jgi:hypothetical protein
MRAFSRTSTRQAASLRTRACIDLQLLGDDRLAATREPAAGPAGNMSWSDPVWTGRDVLRCWPGAPSPLRTAKRTNGDWCYTRRPTPPPAQSLLPINSPFPDPIDRPWQVAGESHATFSFHACSTQINHKSLAFFATFNLYAPAKGWITSPRCSFWLVRISLT